MKHSQCALPSPQKSHPLSGLVRELNMWDRFPPYNSVFCGAVSTLKFKCHKQPYGGYTGIGVQSTYLDKLGEPYFPKLLQASFPPSVLQDLLQHDTFLLWLHFIGSASSRNEHCRYQTLQVLCCTHHNCSFHKSQSNSSTKQLVLDTVVCK